MRPIRPLTLAVLAAALPLIACNGPTVTEISDTKASWLEGFYAYGAAGRDIKLTVSGTAFGLAPDEAARQVEQAIGEIGTLSPATRPRLHPDGSARDDYAIAMVLNPAPGLSGDKACTGKISTVDNRSGDVTMLAAFCIDGRSYSTLSGETKATSAADPSFGSLVAQLGRSLFYEDPTAAVVGPNGGGISAPASH